MARFLAAKAAVFCCAWFGNGALMLRILAALFHVLHVMLRPERVTSHLPRQLSQH